MNSNTQTQNSPSLPEKNQNQGFKGWKPLLVLTPLLGVVSAVAVPFGLGVLQMMAFDTLVIVNTGCACMPSPETVAKESVMETLRSQQAYLTSPPLSADYLGKKNRSVTVDTDGYRFHVAFSSNGKPLERMNNQVLASQGLKTIEVTAQPIYDHYDNEVSPTFAGTVFIFDDGAMVVGACQTQNPSKIPPLPLMKNEVSREIRCPVGSQPLQNISKKAHVLLGVG